jgi:hypothetical protein
LPFNLHHFIDDPQSDKNSLKKESPYAVKLLFSGTHYSGFCASPNILVFWDMTPCRKKRVLTTWSLLSPYLGSKTFSKTPWIQEYYMGVESGGRIFL